MGVYLSEPNTAKEIKEGNGSGVVFCKAEMQGNTFPTQVGEKTWKMQPSMKQTSETETHSSESLTVMEVLLIPLRSLGQQIRRGQIRCSTYRPKVL